ncbi:MAG: hypothetical protein AB1505_13755 [Candidatus Latescibacterota bacterium]
MFERVSVRLTRGLQAVRVLLEPVTSELGAVPSGEGMSFGWIGVFVLAVAIGLGAMTPTAAYPPPPIWCHGCYLQTVGQCAVYQCTYAYPECPIYVPVKMFKTTMRSQTGNDSYCEDSTLCVSSCDANCGACVY